MKTRLDTLKQLRSDIISERTKLNAELSKIDEIIALYQPASARLDNDDKPISASVILHISDDAPMPSGDTPSSPGVMKKAIQLALEMYDAEQRPIVTGEVLSALLSRGFHIGGKSPSGNVSSYLKHSDELANMRGRGWVRIADLDKWKQAA